MKEAPRKQFNTLHLKIYEFIEESGSVPSRGKMKYWEDKFIEWNRLYPKYKYKKPDGLRIAHLRIKKAIDKNEGINKQKIKMILGQKDK